MVSVQSAALGFIDYFVIGFIVLSGIIGFVRGFVLEFFGICVWVLAFVGAKLIFPYVNQFFTEYISHAGLLCATSWFLSYSCAFIVFIVIKHLASMAVKGSNLSGLDRLIGFPFGIVRGCVVIAVLLFVFSLFSQEDTPDCLTKSRCYPIFSTAVRTAYRYLDVNPGDLSEKAESVKTKIANDAENGWSEELKETEKQVDVLSNPEPKQPELKPDE